MKKILYILILLSLLTSCTNQASSNTDKDVVFDEKENQIIFEIKNDINNLFNFNPVIQWTAVKENYYDPCHGGGNTINIYIKDSQILTIELTGYKFKFSYDTEYPYADVSFDLSDDVMLNEDPNNFVLTRLTERYSFTISELLQNQLTIIGEIYNKESHETYILALILHEESCW